MTQADLLAKKTNILELQVKGAQEQLKDSSKSCK
jgi:hypothetical protein